MYKKVMVPLDGSELAECALSHVENLAKDGAIGEVILFNVIGIDVPWDEMEKGLDFGAVRQKFLLASQRYLADVEAKLHAQGIKVRSESIEANRPANVIAEYARKNDVDLIVIASHGYTGMKKLMFGSVALGVLHLSPAAVFFVRPESCQA